MSTGKGKSKTKRNQPTPENQLSPSQREMIILERLESMNNRMNEMAAQGSPRTMMQQDINGGSPGSRPGGGATNPYAQQDNNEAQMLAFRQKVSLYHAVYVV